MKIRLIFTYLNGVGTVQIELKKEKIKAVVRNVISCFLWLGWVVFFQLVPASVCLCCSVHCQKTSGSVVRAGQDRAKAHRSGHVPGNSYYCLCICLCVCMCVSVCVCARMCKYMHACMSLKQVVEKVVCDVGSVGVFWAFQYFCFSVLFLLLMIAV